MPSKADVHASCSPVNCDITVGAALIGFTIALCLYGITTGQALLYLARYDRDRPFWFWARCHVTAIWIVDTAHTVFLAQAVFYYCVTLHGNPTHLGNVIIWPYGAIVISAEVTTALVRTGYAYKIWKFNNRKVPLPMVVLTLSTILLALGLLYGIEECVAKFRLVANFEWSFYAAFSANLSVDIVIAASILFLFRGFFTGIRRFDVILQVVVFCVIGAGLLSVVLTTLSLVLYLIWPATFLYIACYWVLTKVHACSFLAVVHAEKELAERASSRSQPSLPVLTTALRVDDGLTAFPGGVETTASNGFSTSFPTTERPLSSNSTEVAEVHRKSKESGVLSLSFSAM